MISFWTVMDRAYNIGPLMKMEKFDIELLRKATDLKKRFGIEFNPEIPVPKDDGFADRVFQAGLELFLEVGVYNAGSERVIRTSGPLQLGGVEETCPGSGYLDCRG